MGGAVMDVRLCSSGLCEHDGCTCHRRFTLQASLGNLFDGMPVPVTGGEIAAYMHSCRIFAQDMFDSAERFDKIPPVRSADETQAADTVCDGNLTGRRRAPRCF